MSEPRPGYFIKDGEYYHCSNICDDIESRGHSLEYCIRKCPGYLKETMNKTISEMNTINYTTVKEAGEMGVPIWAIVPITIIISTCIISAVVLMIYIRYRCRNIENTKPVANQVPTEMDQILTITQEETGDNETPMLDSGVGTGGQVLMTNTSTNIRDTLITPESHLNPPVPLDTNRPIDTGLSEMVHQSRFLREASDANNGPS